ncbi:hypothetical protein HB780_14595 [Rhizobium lusitanum]|uniref:hypothetical protein n=1 Tax=Rhizobium lusitanum TaxID=293958 RepID=UPI00161CDCBF|nr:hypothetical protein [Rhizobium lusitanum]QND46965.1 hypothetical protein HB780_14595 [Rhizobium lusitanum]
MSKKVDRTESIFGKSAPPRATDILFGGDREDWQSNACISHWGEFGHAYKSGFRKAALQLAVEVCNSSSDQDLLIYPIVYLYRHHIELVLKDIFRSASMLLGHGVTAKDENDLGKHDLTSLWDMVRPLLKPVCDIHGVDGLPDEDFDAIASYIAQIHDHDPDGQRFRYATVKRKKANAPKGAIEHRRSLGPDLKLINIRVFATNLEKLADYLDGLEIWLADSLEIRFTAERDASAAQ